MTLPGPTPTPAEHRAAPVPLWLLTLLAFSGTVGMYIFLPALPFAARELGTSAAAVQLAVSMYLAGLAIGQLVYGPLSDRFGRRPVLQAGLVLYTAAGLGAALSSGADALNLMRLVQGFGGSAGLVLGRAMVRDTSAHGEAARRLAMLNLAVTVGPGLAPVLGAALAEHLGWRSILVALTLLGAANLGLGWWKLAETRPSSAAAEASWVRLRANYARLLRSITFLGFAFGGGLATTAMYGLFAATPFMFVQQLHRPVHEVGLFLTLLVSGLWFGSYLALRLLRHVSVRRLLVMANLVGLVMAVLFLGMAGMDWLSVVGVGGLMFAYAICVGVAAPTALAEAVNVDPAVVGTASGIYGFSQMAVGAGCIALVGLGSDPALSAALLLVGSGILSQAAFWLAARAQGRGTTG